MAEGGMRQLPFSGRACPPFQFDSPKSHEMSKRTIINPERHRLAIRVKYALDRVVALALLIVGSPLLALIAIAVKLEDGGPIFFRQERLGINGSRFLIWKFRSMVPGADKLLDRQGSVGNLNRITRVGRILRRLSLDELPQLINILRGEMSIVGPRPTLPDHWGRYTEEQKGRAAMRPGVTGLSQVNGRNTLRWSKRIEGDLRYVRDYSFRLDLSILLRTVWVVLLQEGIVLDRNPEQVDDLASAGSRPRGRRREQLRAKAE